MKKIRLWFIVDTSGSMYGSKKEAIESAITEGLYILDELSGKLEISVGFSVFNETFKSWQDKPIDQTVVPKFEVERDNEGYCRPTYYTALYKGMADSLRRYEKDGSISHIFILCSDGKAIDGESYKKEKIKAENSHTYCDAKKYAIYAGEKGGEYNKNLLEFVDNKADHIKSPDLIAAELQRVIRDET